MNAATPRMHYPANKWIECCTKSNFLCDIGQKHLASHLFIVRYHRVVKYLPLY